MRSFGAVLLMTSGIWLMCGTAQAEKTVTLSGVHLCCPACEKAVNAATESLEGTTVKCDRPAGTVTITASGKEAVQTAIDALAEAGFTGSLDDKEVALVKVDDVPQGKVARLELSTHNCCPMCANAIKEAAGEVDGVQATMAKPRENFVVEGNFSAQELIDAMSAAGFQVKVVN